MSDQTELEPEARPAQPLGGFGGADVDWPEKAADTIVERVDQAKGLVTDRVVTVARAVVFAFPLVVLTTVVMIAMMIGSMRLAQVGLGEIFPGDWGRAVWVSYVAVGSLLVMAGTFLWRSANRVAIKIESEL